MKAVSISIFVALGIFAAVGCAAPTEEGEETTAQAGQAPEENVGSQSSSLINTSSSGGLGWSATCKACKDQCDSDFPRGGGPLQTCKDICVKEGKCSVTTGPGWGPIGPIAF